MNSFLSGGAALLTFAFGFFNFRLHRLSSARFISFINQRYPQLEESADLLIKDYASLNPLEHLQRERTIEKFNQVFPLIRLPHHIGRASLIFLASLASVFVLISFSQPPQSGGRIPPGKAQAGSVNKVQLPASMNGIVISITPPAYTMVKPYRSGNPVLTLPEDSRARWMVEFTDSVDQVHFVFSGRDTSQLAAQKNFFALTRNMTQSGFYQFLWKNKGGDIKTSDFFKIEVIHDHAPETTITNLKQSTDLKISDKLKIDLKATITDDYSINDAYIIATVSKGSGESVKFREEKLSFTSPQKIGGKHIDASRLLDLVKLGMEPGDELYFYVEASDNRQPLPQRSRTETYFITLLDTASENLSVEAGLGVDLMPEYFRSQRQIIIDTEKLLKQRKQLTKQAFNFTSNELGYDQKVLRLKYGEFLGEEFESEIAETEDPAEEQPVQAEDGEEEDGVEEQFGHAHDKDNEHNLVDEKKQAARHDHVAEEEDPEKEKDPLASFKHLHDNLEEATFFTQSIRAKLKAALTVMWDAELHLRLFDPEKSLPYQYRALKLLKEISNDSRIYVHKTGFDPPPIKEDKRLTGDLAELKSTTRESQHDERNGLPGIMQGFALTEKLLHRQERNLSAADREIFQLAARELSVLAIEHPGRFLTTLSQIKALNEGEIKGDQIEQTLILIRKSFWRALPSKTISPGQQDQLNHTLDQLFIKNLDALKNE